MKEIYVFTDETGDLGYTSTSSDYFGFGSVSIDDSHSNVLWESFKLRCELEAQGIQLMSGFHAQQDKFAIRARVFNLILESSPRFDFTFLKKAHAYDYVRARGDWAFTRWLGIYISNIWRNNTRGVTKN
jgi:hypothetical protein